MQKAREGKWVGGFAPYGYKLVDGSLQINEEEAEAIRIIFDKYLHTDMGASGVARYLELNGIRKIARQNGTNPLFDAHLIRTIIQNPVYCGKIAYGRRRMEKIRGTRNEYHQVKKKDYLLTEGHHEALVSEEDWQACQIKAEAQSKKYEHVNRGRDERIHLLFTFYRDNREDVLINVPVNQEQQKIITNTYAYIYSLLKEDPTQTREALAKRSGKTIRTIQRILAKLSAEGKIKRIGSNKTGYWEVLDAYCPNAMRQKSYQRKG